MRVHSDEAWGVASMFSWALASSTRDLAAQIDTLRKADTDEITRLRAENKALRGHLGRVLYLHQGCWHPHSIFQREYGHEIEAARAALEARHD